MTIENDKNNPDRSTTAALKRLIRLKWPETVGKASDRLSLIFSTGMTAIDTLFPQQGIPYGQLVEITGAPSSGKTSLLLKIMAAPAWHGRVVYIDLSRSFFPAAAAACGVDMDRLLTINPTSMPGALHAAGLLLSNNLSTCVAIDLVGQRETMPIVMLHRLRLKTSRARGMVIFLTENNSGIIPPSTVALRLHVALKNEHSLTVTVTKSRISREGTTAEVSLNA